MPHFVDDPARDLFKQRERDLRPVGGHEIGRRHRTQNDRIVICPLIAHHADTAHVRQRRKILIDIAVDACLRDLLAEDRVRIPHNIQLFLRDIADHPDGKTRTRERLTPDKFLRNAEFETRTADLVLKEDTQRLDDLLEIHIVRQTADIMMAFDHRGRAGSRLDHVRIDRSLHKEIHCADLFCFFFKDPDELRADDLAFLFRVGNAGKFSEEPVLGIDADQIDVELFAEDLLDLIPLVLPEKAVIDEDAGQLFADSLVDQDRGNRRIDAA